MKGSKKGKDMYKKTKKGAGHNKKKRTARRYHGQYLLSFVLAWFVALFAYGIYATDPQIVSSVNYFIAQFGVLNFGNSQSEDILSDNRQKGDIQVMEVHYLDVGQGDATFLKCGGQTMLIDAGEEDQGTAIQYYLMQQGIEKLDYLVLTHPDSDHIGSADVVITKFSIGHVMMSDYKKDSVSYRNLMQALEYMHLTPQYVQAGETFTLGSAVCTILAPVGEYEDANNASVILLVQNGANRFLFTGDAEEEAEEDILKYYSSGGILGMMSSDNALSQDAGGLLADTSLLRADVYKVGHHGSSSSSTKAFLEAVSPKYAVISCGRNNEYGHPHEEILKRLQEHSAEIFRTDEQGSIVAVSDGENIYFK